MERYREEKQKLIDEIDATPEFTEQWVSVRSRPTTPAPTFDLPRDAK